jgi:arginase
MGNAVQLILAPYDCGQLDERMGRGPHALMAAGIPQRLKHQKVAFGVAEVAPANAFRAEIATTFELQRLVRRQVEAAISASERPITISGNCNTGVVGSLAAHAAGDVGLIWLDAHSDAETPETTTSGLLDGMGLAMALRCCWQEMLHQVGEWSLPGERAALVGAREISPAVGTLLRQCGVAIVSPSKARDAAIDCAVDQLRGAGVRRIHLHLDLDVLDSRSVGPANSYALPDGLSAGELLALLGRIACDFTIASASVASYDPVLDTTRVVAAAGLEAIALIACS